MNTLHLLALYFVIHEMVCVCSFRIEVMQAVLTAQVSKGGTTSQQNGLNATYNVSRPSNIADLPWRRSQHQAGVSPKSPHLFMALSTNDVYKPRGARFIDDGRVPYVLEGDLLELPGGDHHAFVSQSWQNLQKALAELPASFPTGFEHRTLCQNVGPGGEKRSRSESMECEQVIANIIPSFTQLDLKDLDEASKRFQMTGALWSDSSLGCLKSEAELQEALKGNRLFGNMADMGMTYLVESRKEKVMESRSFLPGDFVGPSFLSFRNHGVHMTEIMKQAIHYVTLGNHEFDFRMMKENKTKAWINDIMSKAPYRSITANVHCKEAVGNCAPNRHGGVPNNWDYVVDMLDGGKKLCVFGVTSDPDAAASAGTGNFGFTPYSDVGIATLKQLQGQHCDLVVAMTHLDLAQDLHLWNQAVQCFRRRECPHVDVILGAHNHYVAMVNLRNPYSQIPNRDFTYLWKMGQDAHLLSKMVVDLNWESRPRISLVPVIEGACRGEVVGHSSWAAMQKIVDTEEETYGASLLRAKELNIKWYGRWDSSNLQGFETRAGNFVADAAASAGEGTDVCVLTAGMVRGDKFLLLERPLSELDIHEDFPFPHDELHQIPVSVWQLVSIVLEALLERRQLRSNRRLIVSGLKIVYAVDDEGYIDTEHHFLGLEELQFAGAQHMLGTTTPGIAKQAQLKRKGIGAASRLLFKNGEFLVDPTEIFTLATSNYHIHRASERKEILTLRFSGEVVRQEEGCKLNVARGPSFGRMFLCSNVTYEDEEGVVKANNSQGPFDNLEEAESACEVAGLGCIGIWQGGGGDWNTLEAGGREFSKGSSDDTGSTVDTVLAVKVRKTNGILEPAFYQHLDDVMRGEPDPERIFDTLKQTRYRGQKVFQGGVWTKLLTHSHPRGLGQAKGRLGRGSFAEALVEGIAKLRPTSIGQEAQTGFLDQLVMLDRNLDKIRWMPDKLQGYWGSELNDPKLLEALQNPSIRAAIQHLLGGEGLAKFNETAKNQGERLVIQRGTGKIIAETAIEKVIGKIAQGKHPQHMPVSILDL